MPAEVVAIRDSRIATRWLRIYTGARLVDQVERDLRARWQTRENQGYRDRFLASIRDRLGTAEVKGQALDAIGRAYSVELTN